MAKITNNETKTEQIMRSVVGIVKEVTKSGFYGSFGFNAKVENGSIQEVVTVIERKNRL